LACLVFGYGKRSGIIVDIKCSSIYFERCLFCCDKDQDASEVDELSAQSSRLSVDTSTLFIVHQ